MGLTAIHPGEHLGNVMIPNMYYRTDMGDRREEDSDRLHNWGYLR